jgi:transcriptional regulator with XRE-family HTH domain
MTIYVDRKWHHGNNQVLVRWMLKHNLSPKKLADKIGVSRTTIQRVLADRGEFTKYVIDALLDETGMTYEELFRWQ